MTDRNAPPGFGRRRFTGTLGLGLLLLAGCDQPITPPPPPQLSLDAELRQSLGMWGAMPIGPMPAQPPAQVELGRALFFDRILSGNRDVACATCHSPAKALGDGLSLSIGTGAGSPGPMRTPEPARQFTPRTAPSLLNSGLGSFYLFWDGRLSGFGPAGIRTEAGPTLPAGVPNVLTGQAMLAVLDRRELRGEPGDIDVFGNPNELAEFADHQHVEVWQALMRRLLAIPEYVEMFKAAFPDRSPGQLRFEHAAQALAAFQREAFTKARSPFDRYLERDDAALTTQEKQGALLFFGRAQCASCHSGPLIGGNSFANAGAPQIGPGASKQPPLDLGRGELLDFEFYRFAFRVPPLRNVELTAPYTHSGAYPTLEAVVRHYNDVPRALREYDVSQLDPAFRDLHHGDETTIAALLATLDFRLRQPLNLNESEIADLVAFLKALTDPAARDLGSLVPARVPSGLPVQ